MLGLEERLASFTFMLNAERDFVYGYDNWIWHGTGVEYLWVLVFVFMLNWHLIEGLLQNRVCYRINILRLEEDWQRREY